MIHITGALKHKGT